MIDITGVDSIKFAQEVYNLSRPQGLGHLHFTQEPLSESEAKNILSQSGGMIALGMDYVKGRACKMNVLRNPDTGALEIQDSWFDHDEHDLAELLERCGVATEKAKDAESKCS